MKRATYVVTVELADEEPPEAEVIRRLLLRYLYEISEGDTLTVERTNG